MLDCAQATPFRSVYHHILISPWNITAICRYDGTCCRFSLNQEILEIGQILGPTGL